MSPTPLARRSTISNGQIGVIGDPDKEQSRLQRRSTSAGFVPAHLSTPLAFDNKKLPAYDAHRRSLRAWLRDVLSVRGGT
jgi:hypothetical protein